MKIAYIILASGYSNRFGEDNKLLCKINGKNMFEITLSNIPFNDYENTYVVTQYEEIKNICLTKNVHVIINNMKQKGIDYSIKTALMGISGDYDGYMFFVADQPYLKIKSCELLVREFYSNSQKILVLSYDKKIYNPAIFPKRFIPDLLQIPENCGGKFVINKYISEVITVEAESKNEFTDIDYKCDLI